MNIFITGTDTDVGKTIITAGLAHVLQSSGYSTAVYKPLQSGAIIDGEKLIAPDPDFVRAINPDVMTKSSYNLRSPSAPSLAAIIDNVEISKDRLLEDYNELKQSCDVVLTEGAGGILVPVFDNFLMRDLAKLFDLPVIIVARPDLGTINHTLLTIEAAQKVGLKVLGVIISNYPENTDDINIIKAPSIINELSGVKVLGILPSIDIKQDSSLPERLKNTVLKHINLKEIFGCDILGKI